MGSVVEIPGLQSTGLTAMVHGFSCFLACGSFLHQASNPCPLHWRADSQPLDHQGQPFYCSLTENESLNLNCIFLFLFNSIGFNTGTLWISLKGVNDRIAGNKEGLSSFFKCSSNVLVALLHFPSLRASLFLSPDGRYQCLYPRKMVFWKVVCSSSLARTPKSQLAAEQASTGQCWIPPKKEETVVAINRNYPTNNLKKNLSNNHH